MLQSHFITMKINCMKVICIDAKSRPNEVRGNSDFDIKEGGKYTVYKTGYAEDDDSFCYCLLEDPDRESFGYVADRFVTTSDIDETEFERNYNTQTA